MTETMLIKGAYEANIGDSAWEQMLKSLARFEYDHLVDRPVLVTSVRKSSTHLVRNFAAHFVGDARVHWDFVDEEQLRKGYETFGRQIANEKWLYTGHVKRSWATNFLFRNARIILVVRDPFTQVVSRAMHFFNEDTREPLAEQLRAADAPIEEAIYYAIYGSNYRGWDNPSIADEYSAIAAAWYDRADVVLRYEDVTGDPDTAVRILQQAAAKLGWAELPDAEARIRAAIKPDISASYWKKNRTIEISDMQKAMIEHLIPGVRRMFGYGG